MPDRKIKVYDKKGFHYEVLVKHYPDQGLSFAYYKDQLIADREFQKLSHPYSDDDSEWERYEESLSEWMDEAESDLSISCKNYFDNN